METWSERYSVSSGKVFIFNSVFNFLQYLSGDGGSILYASSSENSILFVEESSILNSRSSGKGGGICFSNSGQCVLLKICGFNCSTTSSDYLFVYSEVTNNVNKINDLNFSSVSRDFSSSYNYNINIIKGLIHVSSTNISCNYCASRVGMRIVPKAESSLSGFVSFSSFVNNTSTSYEVIALGYYNGGPLYRIESCNILANNEPISTLYGIISAYSIAEIENSCILENTGGAMIFAGNSVAVINCTHDIKGKTQGSVTFIDNALSSFINKLNHISTQMCVAVYDSIRSLTVAPDPKKKRSRYVCLTVRVNVYKKALIVSRIAELSVLIYNSK